MSKALKVNILLVFFVAQIFLQPNSSAAIQSDANNDRMVAVAKLWSDVKWSHPSINKGKVNWDEALVSALPAIQSATTTHELQQALGELMAPLHDPALKLIPELPSGYVNAPDNQPLIEWIGSDTALLHIHRYERFELGSSELRSITEQIDLALSKANALIIDLRPAGPGVLETNFIESVIAKTIDKALVLPTERFRIHSGYKPQRGNTSGGYFSATQTLESRQLQPVEGSRKIPTVFILNNMQSIPKAVLSLQHQGKAWLVAQGNPNASWVVPTRKMRIDRDTVIQFSVGELIFEDGSSGFGADAVTIIDPSTAKDSVAVSAALDLVRAGGTPGSTVQFSPASAVPIGRVEEAYRTMRLPDLPWRQLSVIKLWAVVDNFFPYKYLMDKQWKDILPIYLKRMESVKSAQEYALAIVEMASNLNDSHVTVLNREIREFLGVAAPGVQLSMVENKVVVSSISQEEINRAGELKVGDVLLSVDGEEVIARINRLSKFISASNEESKIHHVLVYLLAGPKDSQVHIQFERDSGDVRALQLARNSLGGELMRSGPVVQVLSNTIGYVDLTRLERADVKSMFDTVKDTKTLIFDLRGYPRGTAWDIAPRLNVNNATFGAVFMRPLISGVKEELNTHVGFEQGIAASDLPLYRGKLIVLIDERTQSQAEHTALFIEAAASVTFIGSRSAGTNGDLTNTVLPGYIYVGFSGQEVRRADGRQLQRVGIAPDIVAHPTVKGIRSGRDEVLERAFKYIRTGK